MFVKKTQSSKWVPNIQPTKYYVSGLEFIYFEGKILGTVLIAEWEFFNADDDVFLITMFE